jgi:hypothetical protein
LTGDFSPTILPLKSPFVLFGGIMNRTAILEAQYDGRVPADALRHAQFLDAEDAKRQPQPIALATPPRPRTRFATTGELIAAMAAVLVERTALDGSCSEDQVLSAGFSRAELLEHGEAARLMAARRMAPVERRSRAA